MEINGMKVRPVNLEDTVHFHCTRCGDCCCNNKETVMLESWDAYQLARYFKKNSRPNFVMDDLYSEFTELMPLNESGFPIALLKTVGVDNHCIFYKNGLCSAQKAKPHTCRVYPFTISPGEDELFSYFLCEERPHHLTGGTVCVKDWMLENFPEEDQYFKALEWQFISEIGRLMQHINSVGNIMDIMPRLLFYRFSNFDLQLPFLPQFQRNNHTLIHAMKAYLLNC